MKIKQICRLQPFYSQFLLQYFSSQTWQEIFVIDSSSVSIYCNLVMNGWNLTFFLSSFLQFCFSLYFEKWNKNLEIPFHLTYAVHEPTSNDNLGRNKKSISVDLRIFLPFSFLLSSLANKWKFFSHLLVSARILFPVWFFFIWKRRKNSNFPVFFSVYHSVAKSFWLLTS